MHRLVIGIVAWGMGDAARAAPGDHIRAGDLGIIPSIDLGAEVRTNVYRDEANAIPGANYRIAPGLLMFASGEDHELRLESQWVARQYLYLGEPEPRPGQVRNLDRFDEYSVALGADTFRRNPVGFVFHGESALRNFRADAEFADVPYSSQFRNSLSGALRIRPGEALNINLGGEWSNDIYRVPSSDDQPDRSLNTRNMFGPTLAAKWAFLPRTSLVADASWMVIDWQRNQLDAVPSQVAGGEIAIPNGDQVKAMAGLDGRFTEKLFAQFLMGYGVALFDERSIAGLENAVATAAQDATGLDGLLIKTQVRYSLTPSDERRRGSSLTTGYVRDFRSSYFTNYVQLNKLFADLQGRLGDVTPSVRYEFRIEDYHGEFSRHDLVNRVSADLKYAAADWVAITGGGWWQQRASDDDLVEYDDVNFHLLATFSY